MENTKILRKFEVSYGRFSLYAMELVDAEDIIEALKIAKGHAKKMGKPIHFIREI